MIGAIPHPFSSPAVVRCTSASSPHVVVMSSVVVVSSSLWVVVDLRCHFVVVVLGIVAPSWWSHSRVELLSCLRCPVALSHVVVVLVVHHRAVSVQHQPIRCSALSATWNLGSVCEYGNGREGIWWLNWIGAVVMGARCRPWVVGTHGPL